MKIWTQFGKVNVGYGITSLLRVKGTTPRGYYSKCSNPCPG